ncbi:MAG: TrkH family potassium uptake protein [Gammaproteobacteria bacterium]|nr:TrkH family potassium uptake protein [Gammaproteobacteria bacterium]
MNPKVVQRVSGLLLMLFSSTMLPPLAVWGVFQEGQASPFLYGFLITLITGFVTWAPVRQDRSDLRLRDGFVIVVAFWTILGTFGALPLFISTEPSLSITDALFESFSGLTTTGATVITGLDELPKSILYYRQQLQWLGGLGIIVLAVAILPMLGVGGMQLYRAETPGPIKDSKLAPRISETAKALWYVYSGLTASCALAYWAAGMSVFDAICHAFSTIAIGGFSTHDASMGWFDSSAINLIASVFMVIAGVNFALHFVAFSGRRVTHYWQDTELKGYLALLLFGISICFIGLVAASHYSDPDDALVEAIFQVVSFATTTGFTTADHSNWPTALPVLLLMASFIGGCAGSTAGGIKVVRVILLLRQGVRELKRLVHPNAVIPVKMRHRVVDARVIDAVWGFFAAYVGIFALLLVLVLMTGLEPLSAFAAVAACLNNLGPGLGEVANNMATVSDPAKWSLILAMLLGRLEIFTLLVLFTPAFWRK